MKRRSRLKALLWFCLAVLVVQGAVFLFCTTEMLEKLLPIGILAVSDSITPNDNSYTEYYDIRRSCGEAQVIAVGIDFSCAESYTLLTDLIVSLKYSIDIGTLLIDADEGQNTLAHILSSQEYMRETLFLQLRRDTGYSDAFYTFLTALCEINDKYPPQRRMSLASLYLPARNDEDPNGAARAAAMLLKAQNRFDETGRPVLILADIADMQDGSPLREESPQLFPMICVYHTALIGSEAKLYVVDRSRLAFFDRMYSAASTHSTGVRMTPQYSEEHLTAYFFLIRNPTYVQHTPFEASEYVDE